MRAMFATVLHSLKSPKNVGTIVRSHVAFGGMEVVFLGHDRPWDFRRSTQAFSRKLERQCECVFLPSDLEFFAWAEMRRYVPIAVEISPDATPIQCYDFPDRCALVVGSEAKGLSLAFQQRCEAVVRINQPGLVGSLNVGVAAGIAMHELCREEATRPIVGTKYRGEAGLTRST